MTTWSETIFLYCERAQDPSFWAEPLNFLSNMAFFISAWFLIKRYKIHRQHCAASTDLRILIVIAFAIGVGSATFHSVATFGAMWLDILPIFLFIMVYLYCFARTLLSMSPLTSAGLFLLLLAINIAYKALVTKAVDGYISYIPTFAFLLALSIVLWMKRHPSTLRIFSASLLSFISLALRTADLPLCDYFPMGTHFLWHICNSILIYLLVREIMIHREHLARQASHAYP